LNHFMIIQFPEKPLSVFVLGASRLIMVATGVRSQRPL
jgi:hypothetical protein